MVKCKVGIETEIGVDFQRNPEKCKQIEKQFETRIILYFFLKKKHLQ